MIQTVNAQLTSMIATIKNMRNEGDARFQKTGVKFTAMEEAIMNRLEHRHNRRNVKSVSIDKSQHVLLQLHITKTRKKKKNY